MVLRLLSICVVALMCGCTAIPINIPDDPDLAGLGDGGPYQRVDAFADMSISLPDNGPPSGGKDGGVPDGFTDAVTDGLADSLPDAQFDAQFDAQLDGLLGDSHSTDGEMIFDGITADGAALNDGMVME